MLRTVLGTQERNVNKAAAKLAAPGDRFWGSEAFVG